MVATTGNSQRKRSLLRFLALVLVMLGDRSVMRVANAERLRSVLSAGLLRASGTADAADKCTLCMLGSEFKRHVLWYEMEKVT